MRLKKIKNLQQIQIVYNITEKPKVPKHAPIISCLTKYFIA